jgi:ABC-type branched-subunit amino acid transport system substrate-binding protein
MLPSILHGHTVTRHLPMNCRSYIGMIFLALILLCLVPSASMRAQADRDSIVFRPDVEHLFVEGMRYFQAGKFDTAATLFLRNIREFPRSHRATGAYIMGAKALYEIENYRESIRLLKDLIDLYPQSTYVDDAHYTLGLDYYRTGRYEDAASEFLTVKYISQEPVLLSRSEKMADLLMSSNLTIPELQLLQSDAKNDEIRAHVELRLAEKIYRTGDVGTAQEILKKVSSMPPNIRYVGDALALLDQIQKKGVIKLGVVLPLMLKTDNLSVRELGLEFLRGIQSAVDEYNQTAPLKLKLEVRDTERDPGVAARQVADLCSDEKIVAIIGPILSNEAFTCAAIANERGVPLITPTATANGIAAIGTYIFQANPDYDVRGRDVAAFAYRKLGCKRFAVLAPSDVVGKQYADSFISEVADLGGEMVDTEWYVSGAVDLSTQLNAMRHKALKKLEMSVIDFAGKIKQADLNKLLRWGVSQQVVDSLVERGLIASVNFLFGENGKAIADSLRLPTHIEPMKYDSLDLPVRDIDAIFVPIASSDEIPVVSSQLKYFNIQAQILGTGDWNDADALDQNRQYTDGVIFTVDSYRDPAGENYRTFVAKYQAANKNKLPGANVLYGYDATKMLVQIIEKGKTRRAEIAGELSKVEGYDGLHSQISLSRNRVNSFLTVMQYKGGRIARIGEIDLARLGE